MKPIHLTVAAALALAAGPLAAQPTTQSRAILFERPNFQGRWVTIFRDAPDLRLGGLGGQAMSGHFDGAWTLCDGPGYSGRCQAVHGDVADLGHDGAAPPIASLRRGAPPDAAPAQDQAAAADSDDDYFDRSASPASAPP